MSRDLVASALLSAFGLCAIALTQAPDSSSAHAGAAAVVVARVRTHDGVLGLTRDSLAEGGKAAHLRRGLANIIADAPAARAAPR